MKTLILTCAIILAAAFTCRAFDWPKFFGAGGSKKTSMVKLPEPAPARKSADCPYPANAKPQEAYDMIETRHHVVIDIRTADEYASGRLEAAAMNLDYYAPDFKEQLAKLDKTLEYLIYCRSGRRSASALGTMKNDLGFTDAHHIEGGITAWQATGYPVVK